MRGRGPGRVQQRLEALLAAEGFTAISIAPVYGHWRSSPYADVHRWEGSAVKDGGCTRTVYSWETMTDCVTRGIVVSGLNKGCSGCGYEVSAKSKTTEKEKPCRR